MRHILLLLAGFFLFASFICHAGIPEERLQAKTITLSFRNSPLGDVLKEIEQQADIRFTYESSLLNGLAPVTFSAENELLDNCLKRLFQSLPLTYQVSGNYIILKRKPRLVTISGFIRDKSSSESLIGASVYEQATLRGTATNTSGFFSVRLNPGNITLQASYIGYSPAVFKFEQLERDTTLIIELVNNASLQEVVVTGSDREKMPVLTSQMGSMEINQLEIKATPTLFGEADIIRTLQLTPGVAAGAEGFTGMYVRGGDVAGNLFLIDGNPIYQISHLSGIFSAFNADAIRSMEFIKAGFPARYGGRLSSVVDVHTKEGNMKEYHGSASIGLISGSLSFEGPIIKDKTSFMFALRRTWLDVLTRPGFAIANHYLKKSGEKIGGGYDFHDLNVRLDHRFNDRSRIFLTVYNGRDRFYGDYGSFEEDDERTPYTDKTKASLKWGNMMATAGWTYVFNNRLFGKLSGVYTQYRSSVSQKQNYEYGRVGDEEYEKKDHETSSVTGISDFGLRAAFDYMPSVSHRIRFGGDAMLHRFRPEYSRTKSYYSMENEMSQLGVVYANELLWGREFSLYAEDDWSISSKVKLNAGLRFTLFNIDKRTYSSLEPRVSLRWLLKDNISLKASYARMNQYVHLVSESYINLPTDSWMPVTARLKPMLSDQVSLGVYYNLNNEYNFSLEGYYKHMNNLLEYRDGYSFLPTFSSWEEKMATGEGRSYGVEALARKTNGRLTGWIGYTLSWADRKFEEINEGNRYPSRYDNRHKLNIVGNYKLSDKVELTASFTYTSGNRTTLSLESYEGMISERSNIYYTDPNYGSASNSSSRSIDYLDERNNYQFSPYHRLNLGINIYRPKESGNMGIWNISIYNVYSRMNPFMIYKSSKTVKSFVSTEWGGTIDYISVPIFKTVGIMPIIPSISYTYKFKL